MNKNNTIKTTFMAFSIVINIVGSFIAVVLKLPIFIDTIGTLLSAFLFGPVSGILTGVSTSLINGLTFDPYSLYFMPVQIVVGFIAGLCYRKGLFKGKRIVFGIVIITICGSFIAAIISAYVFGGITSSGTSFIIMYLKQSGVNIITSIFSTQILFDLLNNIVTVFVALTLLKSMPRNIKIN